MECQTLAALAEAAAYALAEPVARAFRQIEPVPIMVLLEFQSQTRNFV